MTTNPFLTNDSLKSFISGLKISKEHKDTLTEALPEMDWEERVRLVKLLIQVYFLDLEEAEAIEKIKKYWRK